MYALLRNPYATVQSELKLPEHWCDILILHLNTKYCRASAGSAGTVLNADKEPFGTRNYRILLEAVPLGNGQTFMHLAYSYTYGTTARLGMLAYLGTAGSKKVGFTMTGRDKDGRPRYIDGLRGLIERNTMRYYLAIEAYLGALSTPTAARLEKRLADWYASVERYPRQLHETGQDDYLVMKRREYRRQQSEF